MPRHRILFQSNPCHLRTGLAENAKTLLAHLYKTSKYDIAHYCTQTSVGDRQLQLTPWKSYGCLPTDQQSINELNGDPIRARNASYGAWNIDNVVKDFKPTIWLGSDDIWSFPKSDYQDKAWYSRINSILHVTVDSLPVLDQAYEQAKGTKSYFTWARFASDEMKKRGTDYAHVSQIYGAMDTTAFSPITEQEKTDLRKRFGIAPDTLIFLFVFRNQLRKSANRILEAFAQFKKENPQVKAAVHFHTSFAEKGQGWDLPKMASYYGVSSQEVLATYVCKNCGSWSVAPYGGEDLNCPACGAQKSMVTPTITNGVPANQMRYVYGLSDACLSIFTSGGQEYHSVQSILCGKMLACTNYSCGQDFCLPNRTADFVIPIGWHPYDEAGTNFIKAASDVKQIASFMRQIARWPKRDIQIGGERARDWAIKTFGIETIGAQWEKVFDAMTPPDWSLIDLTKPAAAARKNDAYAMPQGDFDDAVFIQTLYKEILIMEERPDGEGFKHWQSKLQGGMKREDIYRYFIQVAQQENAKNGFGSAGATASAPNGDFWSVIDKTTGRKRGLILIKESIGDICLGTSLFKSFHRQHPDTDLYVATDPKYSEILAGNEDVFRVLPYAQAMENELLMIGQGQLNRYFDYFYHIAVQTQRLLSYLSQPEPAFSVVQPLNTSKILDLFDSYRKDEVVRTALIEKAKQ